MDSRGFYQCLRPTAQGLVLNVDLSAIFFHKIILVLEYLWESSKIGCKENQALSKRELREANKSLKGLKIKGLHGLVMVMLSFRYQYNKICALVFYYNLVIP